MNHFIKFQSMVINTIRITKIDMDCNKYCIHLTNNNINGFFLFSSGSIASRDEKIDISKDKDPSDYKVLTDWINKLPQ